jgi:hypothetical protein
VEPQDANRCPTYLHYKWGLRDNPAAALDSFHRELQTKALGKLKEEVKNDELWMEMVKKKFQDKPIVAPPVYIADQPPAQHHNQHQLHQKPVINAEIQRIRRREQCLDKAQDITIIAAAI